jgi:DNA-binding NarL/FixJ family response regulator
VLDGLSNRTIAQVRGTSVRTVANQIASVFRKLNVTGRAELGDAVVGRKRG